jgi:hypothetical protein
LLTPVLFCTAAIRFVLNDAFAGVGPEERQKLLHVSGAEVAWPLLCLQHQLLADTQGVKQQQQQVLLINSTN